MHKAILIQRTIGIIVILSIILGGPVVSGTVRAQQAGADRLPDQIQSPDAVWGFTDVDNNNAEVGYYTSIALDAEGKPHISYFDAISQELKYASYSGSTWGWEVVDNAVNPGQYTSLAVDDTGSGNIAYYDSSTGNLDFAWYDGTSWHTETVSPTVGTPHPLSLKLDVLGHPHIAYRNSNNDTLYYAQYTGTNWQVNEVTAFSNWKTDGYYPSLALDEAGLPSISFCTVITGTQVAGGETTDKPEGVITEPRLIYTHYNGVTWQTQVVEQDMVGCADTSLVFDSSGKPHIAYFKTNIGLRYAHYTGSAWQLETPSGLYNAGHYASLALDSSGRPHIAHQNTDGNSLIYSYYDGAGWRNELVETSVGGYVSMALAPDDRPHISYMRSDTGIFSLRYATTNPLPDLVITNVWSKAGHIEYQIMNRGSSPVTTPFMSELRIDSVLVGNDAITTSIQPGERLNRTFLSSYTCSGLNDAVQVIADSANVIQEADKTNNSLTKTWKCDTVRPKISTGPTVTGISQTSATINWRTDKIADSTVDYGKKARMLFLHAHTAILTINHAITLNSLTPGATYNYKVTSVDGSGNTVSSQQLVFTTLPAPASPPPIQDFTVSRRAGRIESYSMKAEFIHPELVDRVEFFMDDELIGTDYSGPDFQVELRPGMRGFTRAYFFTPHEVTAYAYGPGTISSSAAHNFEPIPEIKPSELTIVSLVDKAEVYFETIPAPAGSTLHLEAYAVEYEWTCDHSGGGVPVCENVASPVQRIRFVIDGSIVYDQSNFPADQFIIGTDWNATGLTAGNHTFNAYMYDHDGNIKTFYGTFVVKVAPEKPPEITRSVERIDNILAVKIAIKNPNQSVSLKVDYFIDDMAGFQAIEASGVNYKIETSYDKNTRTAILTYDLFSGTSQYYTIPANTTVVFMYNVVPVMSESQQTPKIGESGLFVQFQQGGEDTSKSYNLPVTLVKEPGGSMVTLATSKAHALRQADYLIVTNPVMLSYVPGTVREYNQALSTMAHLAALKKGALGFLVSYSVTKTQEMLRPGSSWTNALSTSFNLSGEGYVLLIGETEVIPAKTVEEFITIPYSDQEYSDTDDNVIPNLVLGRAIGDTLADLRHVLQNSIDVSLGSLTFDRSNAMILSGQNGGEDEMQQNANVIESTLTGQGLSAVSYTHLTLPTKRIV